MTPDKITALFAEATMNFTPIAEQPNDDNLTAIKEVLMPLLLDLEYNMNGPQNFIGLIQDTMVYTIHWHQAFVQPNCPTNYNANISDAATPVVQNRMEAVHTSLLNDYPTFIAAERGVVKFIKDVIQEVWYHKLHDIDT